MLQNAATEFMNSTGEEQWLQVPSVRDGILGSGCVKDV